MQRFHKYVQFGCNLTPPPPPTKKTFKGYKETNILGWCVNSHPLSKGVNSHPLSKGVNSHPLSKGVNSHPLSKGKFLNTYIIWARIKYNSNLGYINCFVYIYYLPS